MILRIARRSIRRNLARSTLVIALIALPVAGFTVADGLVRSVSDRDVDVDRAMGTADLRIDAPKREGVDRLLPAGSRVVPIAPRLVTGSLPVSVGDRTVRTKLDVVTLGDPLTRHLARLSSGRLPGGPREVLVTRSLAEWLGVLDGDGVRQGTTLTVADMPTVTVTGMAEHPYDLDRQAVVARPGSVLEDVSPVGYLVDLPAGVGVDLTELLDAWPGGQATAVTRESFQDMTPIDDYLLDAMGEPVALFAGLGLLAIVLTAGAAFAVGARRQIRELGLVTANGGTAAHVRRIVLAQGLVLGVLGAATGLVAGAAVTVLGCPLWERVIDQRIENLRFGWVELAVAAAVGVLASVMAALVPAFEVARMRPVDALAGRFRADTPRRSVSLPGVLAVTAGALCLVGMGVLGRQRTDENTLPVGGILLGAVLTVAGLVLVVPALVAGAARFGGRLPLSGRMAVRDAARHRRRTTAVVVAVMITVAGSVTTAFVFLTRADNTARTLPENVILAELDATGRYHGAANGRQQLEQAVAGMTEAAPGAVAHEITYVARHPDEPGAAAIVLDPGTSPPPRCQNSYAELGVGDPDLIELATGREPDTRLRAALADGKVVVFDDCLIGPTGTVRLQLNVDEPVELPAYLAQRAAETEHYDILPGAFISPRAAAGHGWEPLTVSVAVSCPDGADVDALRAIAEDGDIVTLVEEPVSEQTTELYLLLAGVTALVALLAAGVTIGLSAAEGRSDLMTLAEIGAPPRRRRTFAGAQALVVAGLGTLAGLVLGGLVGYAATPVTGAAGLSVPWQHLVLTTVCVPLLAAVVAMLASPSRLPTLVRRQS